MCVGQLVCDKITVNCITCALQNVLTKRPKCYIAIVYICARCINAKRYTAEQEVNLPLCHFHCVL